MNQSRCIVRLQMAALPTLVVVVAVVVVVVVVVVLSPYWTPFS